MIDPTFDPNDVLPNDPYLQIPLDAQPIDLEGLSAQGKQRQWIHPDNIIPTTASMHGQRYSNMQQAQVATFNDDKQLRVEATIAGGGGAGGSGSSLPLVNNAGSAEDGTAALGVSGVRVGGTFPLPLYVFGYDVEAMPVAGSSGVWYGFVELILQGDVDSNELIRFTALNVAKAITGDSPANASHASLSIGVPLHMDVGFLGASVCAFQIFNGTNMPIIVNGSYHLSVG